MNPLLQIQTLTKCFAGTPVFEAVSLELNSGDRLALLGPSGCGKSTLLRLVAGLDSPSRGEIWIEQRPVSRAGRILAAPHTRRVAMVFQNLALWPNLSALENVVLGLAGSGLDRKGRRLRALETLERCAIKSLANRRPAALSGGQQQRVALARALATRPRLLLLDEPFSGLDIRLKLYLFEDITTLANDFEIALILVTHDPWEAVRLCRRVHVLEDGRTAEEGLLSARLKRPGSETLRAFARTGWSPIQTGRTLER